MRRNYANILIILVLALSTVAYYAARFDMQPVLNQSTPLLNPQLKPTITLDLSFLHNSSNNPQGLPNSSDTQQNQPSSPNSGSTIIIQPSPIDNSSQTPISSIKLGVYEIDPDGGPIRGVSAINWSADGPIVPGQSRNSQVLFFVNEGNVQVTMSLSASAWSFKDYLGNSLGEEYKNYFSLSWNYDNSTFQVNQAKPVVLTLTVSPDIVEVDTFSFDLVITVIG